MKQITVIGVLLVLVFLAGCAKTPTGGVTYQELCKSNGGMFMTMPPTIDGVATGEPSCAGCMVGRSHFCDQEDYVKALSS